MRLIDADKLFPDVMTKREALAISQGQLAYAPTVEAIPKPEYEAKLKADMVTMLQDLDLQIDESATYNLGVAKVQRLIRDKIDKLKENKEV